MGKIAAGLISREYQSLFDSRLDASFILGEDGAIVNANAVAVRYYGYSQDELIGMNAADLSLRDNPDTAQQRLRDLLNSPAMFESRHRRKDGAELIVEVHSQPIELQGQRLLIVNVRDITQRRRIELELREKEHFLERVVNAEPGTVYVFDLDERRNVYVNRHWFDSFGYSVDQTQAMGSRIIELFHPDDLPVIEANHAAWRDAADGEFRDIEYRIRDSKGRWHWVFSRETPFARDHGHKVVQILGIVHDITGRKLAEQAWQESTERLTRAERVAHVGHWSMELPDGPIHWSDELWRIFGREPGSVELTYAVFSSWLRDDFRKQSSGFLQRLLNLSPGQAMEKFVYCLLRPDGEERWAETILETSFGREGRVERMFGTVQDVTERRLTAARLHRLTQLYAALSQCNQAIVRCTSEAELFPQLCQCAVEFGGMQMAWIGLLDDAGKAVIPVASYGVNTDCLRAADFALAAGNMAGLGPASVAIGGDRPCWCQDLRREAKQAGWSGQSGPHDWLAIASLPLHRDGRPIGALTVHAAAVNAFDDAAQNLLVEMATDIDYALDRFAAEDERKQGVERLRESEQRLRTIIETEPECVKIIGRAGELIEMNAAGLAMLEVGSLGEARDSSLFEFIFPEHRSKFRQLHDRVMQGESGTLEFEIIGRRGTRRWLETHAAPMRDADGAVTTLLGITRDITERKTSEQRIQYLANFDALTGLPNRNLLAEHLEYAINMVKRNDGRLTVMFIDLDRFKDINDTLGHSLGDAFLVEVSTRLKAIMRESDTASRLGGDEFILVLPDSDAQAAVHIADKLLEEISRPYHIDQHDLVVTTSIGIALYPHDGKDLESLLRSADTAMYRAKQEGRNGYRFFTADMQDSANRHMLLVNAMRHGLELGQFELHFQPQLSIADDSVVGLEALLRWNHPELGSVSPVEFIPVAEDCGLILPIGEWVIRTAVVQLKKWCDAGHPPMVVAVNLSAVQFRHRGLPEAVSSIVREAGLPAEYLELELTESVAMHDPQGAIAVMDRLDERGIRMSIDDFGTGYSSLSYLKKFKVYKLKIDQSFIRDISTDAEDKAIVAAIISMARSLGLKTIAEGVETVEQLEFLKAQGCDEAQGYFFSKPLPAADMEAYLAAR